MDTSIISALDSLKASIEQLIFDIGQGKEHKILHSSAIALLVKTAELKSGYEKVTPLSSPETRTVDNTSPQSSDNEEISKVARKLPKWANNPQQINSRILNLYLFLQQQTPNAITEAYLRSQYGNDSEFDRNFSQMKIIAPKNHAKVFEIVNGAVNIWNPVLRNIKDYEKKVIENNHDSDLRYLHNAFETIFGYDGHSFGMNASPFRKGLSDGNQGVQWNFVVDGGEGVTRLGINLEGMKYDDWPIARFIENELSDPDSGLLSLSDNYADASDVFVRMVRDAWQALYRPPIEEKIIGGSYVPLSELTPEKWETILEEAYDCLNADKNHRGRATQMVTLQKSGENVSRPVTPHLTISVPLWWISPPSQDMATDIIREKMNYMQSIYTHLASNIG